MGRADGKDKAPTDIVIAANMLINLAKRQLSLLLTRYRTLLIFGVALLLLWVLLGGSSKNYEQNERVPPPLPTRASQIVQKRHSEAKLKSSSVKEYSDFDIGPLEKDDDDDGQQDQNKKIKQKLLYVPASNNVDDGDEGEDPEDEDARFPDHDLQRDPHEAKAPAIALHQNVQKSSVRVGGNYMAAERNSMRRANTLNGVRIPQFTPDDTVDWAVVGGLDIYRNSGWKSAPEHDEFATELAKQVPGLGEGGEKVILTGREKELGDEIKKTEAFNLVVSDKISYTRSLPDTRDPRCLSVYYDNDLPTTSIIIIFTNEAWSPLIRTIYSVLNRSPAHLIHEIILVDDFSDKKHLGSKLERFINKYFPSKVKLMRLKKREGLIRARLEGAKVATGDVILFLDSHCECNTGWLEPLLQRIKENPMAFVVPIIDVIDDNTMEYYHSNGNYFQVGGFTWSGHFTWIDIPTREMNRRGSPIAPTRSPTMAGGLFAVKRSTFWELGSYDPEMDVWGGENLEMSFRIWQCGGVLETIPCSRVGHIFRSFHPYSFPGNKDTHGINTARTVEVWMDEYRRLFYMHRPDLLNTEIGEVSSRLAFKEARQCKPFSWFLENIYPEKFVLDSPSQVFAYGRLRNQHYGTCLDNLQNEDKEEYELGEYACHNFMAAAQFFSFSKKYEIRREDFCAQVTAPFPQRTEKVTMGPCHGQLGTQEWAHTKDGRIIHKATKKCLDGGLGHSMDILYVAPCQNIPSQIWYFDHYYN